MKTATIPSLRVEPALRQSVESLLQEGESLSAFVEQSIREAVAHRRAEKDFLERGLAAREAARRTGDYASTAQVLEGLQGMLDSARHAKGTKIKEDTGAAGPDVEGASAEGPDAEGTMAHKHQT